MPPSHQVVCTVSGTYADVKEILYRSHLQCPEPVIWKRSVWYGLCYVFLGSHRRWFVCTYLVALCDTSGVVRIRAGVIVSGQWRWRWRQAPDNLSKLSLQIMAVLDCISIPPFLKFWNLHSGGFTQIATSSLPIPRHCQNSVDKIVHVICHVHCHSRQCSTTAFQCEHPLPNHSHINFDIWFLPLGVKGALVFGLRIGTWGPHWFLQWC
jgi:hypothetical protein